MLKRNSIELAKLSLERKKGKPILKITENTAIDMTADPSEIDPDVDIQKQVHLNGGFVKSEDEIKKDCEFDYEYTGYTLEITDKVRVVPISGIAKVEDNAICVVPLPDESFKKKRNRTVSFRRYDSVAE